MNNYVIRFRDGKYLRRADYPAPCRVSTDRIEYAERFSKEAAERYLIGKDDPRMNYFYGAVAIRAAIAKGEHHE